MRILHFSYAQAAEQYKPEEWLNRIGFVVGVLESLSTQADVIGIYHIQFEGSLQRNKVKYYFTNHSRWQLLFPFKFNSFVRNLNPDVIILQGLIFPWQILLLIIQLKGKIKIIVQHRAEKPFRDFRKYLQQLADRYISAYLFSASELGMLWVKQKQIKDESKIKIVMGVSSPFFPLDRQEARKQTPITGTLNYLWVGNLTENKDPICAARAFGEFLKQSREAHLWFIYQGNQLEAQVKRWIEVNNLSSSIHLIGRVNHSELQYWYNSVDFIVSCSHNEASGIAVCEAMSCGCIPIVSDIPSFMMMTDNGRMGLLFKTKSHHQLLDCLKKSISMNIEVEKQKALLHFKRELSFEANAAKIMEVINQI